MKEEGGKTIKTLDISGFGGGYEATCQKMLTAGLAFLAHHSGFNQNIIGIATAENSNAKDLNAAILKASDNDCTGAMHQYVVNHLAFISTHSYYEWIGEAVKRLPERIVEIKDQEREMLVLEYEGRKP